LIEMAKEKWQAQEVIGGKRCYARRTRTEIIVRVEMDGDTSKYSEWSMPKAFGIPGAMAQAAIQTKPEDMKL
jgi:hypothetical protein